MAQQLETQNTLPLVTTPDSELSARVRSAAGSNSVRVYIPHTPEERRESFLDLRKLTCAEITDPTTKLVLCQSKEPSTEELSRSAISSLRFGKAREQCGVTLDRQTLGAFVSHYVNSNESREELAQFAAYHEGAHCQQENSKGHSVSLQDVVDMEPTKLQALTTYREAHADAYAILALAREKASSGQIDTFRKFLGEAASGFAKPEAQELNNPLTRSVLFEAFSLNRDKLDNTKLASLTDEQLSSLAARIAQTGVAALNGKASKDLAGTIQELIPKSPELGSTVADTQVFLGKDS